MTGNEDQSITLTVASTMTKRFRDTITSDPTVGHLFSKKIFTDILNQANCVGIRIYYAIDDTGKKQLVLSGVDASENDLYNGVLGDRSFLCPPHTSISNPLNS